MKFALHTWTLDTTPLAELLPIVREVMLTTMLGEQPLPVQAARR